MYPRWFWSAFLDMAMSSSGCQDRKKVDNDKDNGKDQDNVPVAIAG